MISKILRLNIIKYFIISCLAAVIDLVIAYIGYKIFHLNYLLACNLGIISGLLFQFLVSIKFVFKKNKLIYSLIIYIMTFLIGLALADVTMWFSYKVICLLFLISKILSMGVPFFIMYFIRKRFLGVKSYKIEVS